MKKNINELWLFLKSNILVSILLMFTIFSYWYGHHIEKYTFKKAEYHITDSGDYWHIEVEDCYGEYGTRGYETVDCEDIDISGDLGSYENAEKEIQKQLNISNKKLNKIDPIGLNNLGGFFLKSYWILFAILSYMVWKKKKS